MPITVSCSHCSARFKVADEAAGKTLKCRKCGKPFKALADEDEDAVPMKASAKSGRIASGLPRPSAAKRRVDADEDEPRRNGKRSRADDERPTPSRKQKKQGANMMLILGLCAGGAVLLLAIAAVGITLLVVSMRRTPEVKNNVVVAKANDPGKPAPPPQPQPPANNPNPVDPNQAAPPPAPNGQPPAAPQNPNALKPGTKITVRAEIQGSPPDFNGDFNKQVVQNLEIALRQKGYTPVPDGGLILQVRASVGNTGKNIEVRTIGGPRPKFKPGQPIQPNQTQTYPIEQITASATLLDAQGAAIWQQDAKFSPRIIIFRSGDPAREMQQKMWQSFDGWTRGNALAKMQ